MDPTTILTIAIGFLGVAISIVIWLASTHASRVQEHENTPSAYLKQVDMEAYERARKIYEGAIEQLESEITRLQSQLREFQTEVAQLTTEVTRLRSRLRSDDTGPQPKI
jgi:predicted RNase H-like nuclease (RuvC/YqgF family)